MRSRAERQQDFESVKSNLFEAGVSVLSATKAHDDMFSTSLKALTEAYEGNASTALPAVSNADQATLKLVHKIQAQQQSALDSNNYEAYIEAEEQLQYLEELEVLSLERKARKLEAQVRIQSANQALGLSPLSHPEQLANHSSDSDQWTPKSLKSKYKTLKAANAALNITAKTWKSAAEQANKA